MKNNSEIKKKTNISVVISTWNSAKTLEAVVRSCLNQTLPPLEILVCDDGSTDNSKKTIEQIGDNRVIWIPSPHTGTPGVPRNNGIKNSKGEWIAICDSDDEWLPTKLEKQIFLATQLNHKAVCTNAFLKINEVITSKKASNWSRNFLSFEDIIKTNNIVCSSVMVHSLVLREVGGFSEIVEYGAFADYICWLRVIAKTDFAFVDEPLVIYDDHPETSIRANKISDVQLKNSAFENFIKWSKKPENNSFEMMFFRFYIWKYKVISKIKILIKKFLLKEWKQK